MEFSFKMRWWTKHVHAVISRKHVDSLTPKAFTFPFNILSKATYNTCVQSGASRKVVWKTLRPCGCSGWVSSLTHHFVHFTFHLFHKYMDFIYGLFLSACDMKLFARQPEHITPIYIYIYINPWISCWIQIDSNLLLFIFHCNTCNH